MTRWRGRRAESRLVWLFGSPRSGSTWLLTMLADHPAVVPVNEPLIGDHLAPFLWRALGLRASDFDGDTFAPHRLLRQKRAYFFAEEFRPVWQPHLRRMLIARFREHLRRYPPDGSRRNALVVIKEPHGSQAADMIMDCLPRARLLFLLRDGRDVVDSSLAAAMKGSWLGRAFPMMRGLDESERLDLAVEVANEWLRRTEVVEGAFESHPGPKLLVRYEDLRRDPAPEMRRVLAWLGLELEAATLADLVCRHAFEHLPADARGPQQFSRAATPGGWRESLSADEREAIMPVLQPKLKELGYPP